RNNSGPYSGALWCQNFCRVRVHHNVFEGNEALYADQPSVLKSISLANPQIDSNIISGNRGQAIASYDLITLDARYNYWGDPSGPYHPTLNPEGRGDTLVQDSILFIPWLTEPPDTTMPSEVTERTHSEIASTWRLVGVYPNPFNSAVRIILAGFTRSDFRLTLHNLLGQEVAVIHAGALTGGELSYTAPPSLATGVYFLRAASRDAVETKKVLFMK
ncbi:MAG: T9SS type A sorting domain-containing protein, partial [bacterium]|nr:T9SS type A sorting domain-containing protein [bacterium]